MGISDLKIAKYYKCQFADEDKFLAAITAICMKTNRYLKQVLKEKGLYEGKLEADLALAHGYMGLYQRIRSSDGMVRGKVLRDLAREEYGPMIYLTITDPKETETERSFDYE